ncbi:hypothetical protein [Pseudoduganella umbonata]|uniref:Uncharacterized protein n=1 Tax=Pseudoduganella umbonata TaxID=864828 RepID=A0A4P8HL02_9BURK|nr:hypothetical protein [Pseudoduganella umbonata]MBB3221285.1 hypothetical protein [Pseudoduganella umbonata]QCP10459.1 hypothetical protein FCL38_08475 [Pseudoduganella umbonata]
MDSKAQTVRGGADDWLIQEFADLVVEHASRGAGASLPEKIADRIGAASAANLQDLKADIAKIAMASESHARLAKGLASSVAEQAAAILELKKLLQGPSVSESLDRDVDMLLERTDILINILNRQSGKIDQIGEAARFRGVAAPSLENKSIPHPRPATENVKAKGSLDTFLDQCTTALLCALLTGVLFVLPMYIWIRANITDQAAVPGRPPAQAEMAPPVKEKQADQLATPLPEVPSRDKPAPTIDKKSVDSLKPINKISLTKIMDAGVKLSACSSSSKAISFANCLSNIHSPKGVKSPIRTSAELSKALVRIKNDAPRREIVSGLLQLLANETSGSSPAIAVDGKSAEPAVKILRTHEAGCLRGADQISMPEKSDQALWQDYIELLLTQCVGDSASASTGQ